MKHFDYKTNPDAGDILGVGPFYVTWANGDITYYNDRFYHRLDGPARISASGIKEWYVNDTLYKNNKAYQKAVGLSDEDMAVIILKYGNVS